MAFLEQGAFSRSTLGWCPGVCAWRGDDKRGANRGGAYAGELVRGGPGARLGRTAAASEFDGKADALASWLAQRGGDFLACRDIQKSAPRPVKRMGAPGIRALMGRLIEAGYDLTPEGRGWRIGDLRVGDMGDTGDKPATAPFLVGDTPGDNRATKPATPATPESVAPPVAHLSPT